MRTLEALVLFTSLMCLACGNIIKHFDLLNLAESNSYCDPVWLIPCQVPANEEVRISFDLIITNPQTNLKFKGILEKMATTKYVATVVFKYYNACLFDDEVVLQPEECPQYNKIPVGTHTVRLDIVLSKTPGFWPWFQITDRTEIFSSSIKQVKVTKKSRTLSDRLPPL